VTIGVCAARAGKVKAYDRLLLDDELGGLSLSYGVRESFSECIVGLRNKLNQREVRGVNEPQTPLLYGRLPA
jgi:hypothetical protein